MSTTTPASLALSPTAVVRAAVEALHTLFFEPLAMADLCRDSWEGARTALMGAGVAPVPPSPAFDADPIAASSLLVETFPALEYLAAGWLSPADLTAAALHELVDRRHDGHTLLFTPSMLQRMRASTGAPKLFGLVWTDTPPLTIVDVLPRGLAQRAGVRRGQAVMTINGQPAAHQRRFEAFTLLDWRDDAVNALVIQSPNGDTQLIELRGESTPLIITDVLPGPIGYLRIDGFRYTDEEAASFRAVLTSFEEAGALGWIIDVRWCGGGVSLGLSRLLVHRGRIFSRQRHNEVSPPDGTTYPMREDHDADETALPFQRPLVILIGPGSISGAESFAGPLRDLGRATLVGERTAGVCGAGHDVELAPDWALLLAARETVFGPNERRFNRIGVPPDVVVTSTPEDEAAGRDPQLEAALAILTGRAAIH
jgi:carboxyl-terminal processing protease